MVKWILFWMILLVNVLGTFLIDEIDVDDLDDEEIIARIKRMPKKNKRGNKTKSNNEVNYYDNEIDAENYLKSRDKMKGVKDIEFFDFCQYATNCTVTAAMFYNSPRVTPPLLIIEEIDLDDLDDEEIVERIKTMPKKNKRGNKTKSNNGANDNDNEIDEKFLKSRDKMKGVKDIECFDFYQYASNCTVTAAMFYNSPRVTPPLPSKLNNWCKSIRYLTRCAMDWNTDCSENTDSLFNEDSIKGHMHVLDNICDDEWFQGRYQEVTECIEAASDPWEDCYATFKLIVDEQKNITREWTHYETHFYLCCAQAQFRRCTLDFLFKMPKCPYEHAVTMQKFSVIVSEGDVFQDCNGNLVYANCPNGDPTPSQQQLRMLMDGGDKAVRHASRVNYAHTHLVNDIVILLCQSVLIKIFI